MPVASYERPKGMKGRMGHRVGPADWSQWPRELFQLDHRIMPELGACWWWWWKLQIITTPREMRQQKHRARHSQGNSGLKVNGNGQDIFLSGPKTPAKLWNSVHSCRLPPVLHPLATKTDNPRTALMMILSIQTVSICCVCLCAFRGVLLTLLKSK